MRGTIVFTEREVKQNKSGMNIFDIFKIKLEVNQDVDALDDPGWYAWRESGGIYTFKWCERGTRPDEAERAFLAEQGWHTGIDVATIEAMYN